MKLRVVVSLLAFAWLLGVAAQAQERQTVDIFAGYSYVRANPATAGFNSFSLNGGSASVAYNVNGWLSGVADFGGYHNTNILGSGVDGTLSTYLFGPRVSYHRFSRVTPFGEVLFGVAHTGASVLNTTNSQNAFAMTVGGGLDERAQYDEQPECVCDDGGRRAGLPGELALFDSGGEGRLFADAV